MAEVGVENQVGRDPEQEREVVLDRGFRGLHSVLDEMIAGYFAPRDRLPGAANREYLRGKDDRIVDIRFTQGENSATLKDVLPGNYGIKLNVFASEGGQFETKYEAVGVAPETDNHDANDFYITLLHEAGHAVHMVNNRSTYHNLTALKVVTQTREQLAQARLKHWPEPIPYDDLARQSINSILEKFREQNYDETMIKRVETDLVKAVGQISNKGSQEELERYIQQQQRRTIQLETKWRAIAERNAWVLAVQALRKLRQQGINLFLGSRQELFGHINAALKTYNDHFGEYATPKYRFLRAI